MADIGTVEYSYTDSQRWVVATVNGVKWEGVDLEGDVDIAGVVREWISAGNKPAACSTGHKVPPWLIPAAPPPSDHKMPEPAKIEVPAPPPTASEPAPVIPMGVPDPEPASELESAPAPDPAPDPGPMPPPDPAPEPEPPKSKRKRK